MGQVSMVSSVCVVCACYQYCTRSCLAVSARWVCVVVRHVAGARHDLPPCQLAGLTWVLF